MVNVLQTRYFVTPGETPHFGRAAERPHMGQPPLSRPTAALKKDLGVRLLDRHSRFATLTQAGRCFLEDSRSLLAFFGQACRSTKLAEVGEMGRMSIAFMMHAACTVVPRLVQKFMACHPQVQVE